MIAAICKAARSPRTMKPGIARFAKHAQPDHGGNDPCSSSPLWAQTTLSGVKSGVEIWGKTCYSNSPIRTPQLV